MTLVIEYNIYVSDEKWYKISRVIVGANAVGEKQKKELAFGIKHARRIRDSSLCPPAVSVH